MKTLSFIDPAPTGLKRLTAYSEAVATGSSEYGETDTVFTSADEGNLVTSATGRGDWHLPVLDIDVPHRLEPSTTEGHAHLYIDVPMKWDKYVKLLYALAEAGVIEWGFADASVAKGATMVRKPGVKKPSVEVQPGGFVPGDRLILLESDGRATDERATVIPYQSATKEGLDWERKFVRVRYDDGGEGLHMPSEVTRVWAEF